MKLAVLILSLSMAALTAGCGALATVALQDKFIKPATVAGPINAASTERAVRAAVVATGKTGWTPKTISAEAGFVLAEYEPVVAGRAPGKDYKYKLEVRIPDKGRGDAQITVTPPQGIMGGKEPSAMASEFLAAFNEALKN